FPRTWRFLMSYLVRAKAILAAYRSGVPEPTNSSSPWHDVWQERAAIMQYDGGLPRHEAETLALEDVVREMCRTGVNGAVMAARNESPISHQPTGAVAMTGGIAASRGRCTAA